MNKVVCAASLLLAGPALSQARAEPIRFANSVWEATMDPTTLRIVGGPKGVKPVEVAAALTAPERIELLVTSQSTASWRLPARDLSVAVTMEERRLKVRFTTKTSQTLNWPTGGIDAQARALSFPDGEGLNLPLDNAFWQKQFGAGHCATAHGGMSMPAWGIDFSTFTAVFIVSTDMQTQVCLRTKNGRLSATAKHQFRERDEFGE